MEGGDQGFDLLGYLVKMARGGMSGRRAGLADAFCATQQLELAFTDTLRPSAEAPSA